MTTASYDFRYNYKALLLAIVAPQYITPDKAISSVAITRNHRTQKISTKLGPNYTDQDLEEVIRLREQGVTWQAIGKLFGIKPETLFAAVKRYKKRRIIV